MFRMSNWLIKILSWWNKIVLLLQPLPKLNLLEEVEAGIKITATEMTQNPGRSVQFVLSLGMKPKIVLN